jgi:hypothetical protein
MEGFLAIVASLFAIIQGGVWLTNGIQRYRTSRNPPTLTIHPSGPVLTQRYAAAPDSGMSPSKSELLTPGDPNQVTPRVAHTSNSAQALPTAVHVIGNRAHETGHTFPPQPAEQSTRPRNSFVAAVRAIWQVIFLILLPILGFAAGMGAGVLLLVPFRNHLADPSVFEDGLGTSIMLGLILLVPGLIALRKTPKGRRHIWIRRISIGITLVITVVMMLVYIFPNNS